MDLIGRDEELAALRETLASSRAVALVGPAGIGKSALAAALCVDRPVLWIDAGGSLAPEVLEVASTGRRDAAELVVIDGVRADEPPAHVMAVVNRTWVPVVLTSREPLKADLAHIDVGPLAPAHGAALLRRGIRHPGRAATLPTPALERLSEALAGVPASLRAAADQLHLRDVADLLRAPRLTAADPSGPADGLRSDLCFALSRLPGPVSAHLLSRLAGADVTEIVRELVREGLAEVYPSGAATVRRSPLAPATAPLDAEREARLHAALVDILPEWEALACEVEPGGGRLQTDRLREAMPALELLWTSPDVDVALRAACVAGVVFQRVGPESKNLELDLRLPVGGEAQLAARWATFPAKSAVRENDGPRGLAALERRPAPAGTLLAADHDSLRARLLELSGQPEQGAQLRELALARSIGTGLEGDVRYRDAVSRYWRGDFEGALDGLAKCLACSDPEVHTLRVVKAIILQSLVRRASGAESTQLLAQMLTIDPLWRRAECQEGPTALVLTAVLRADLGHWTEADAMLGEAVELFLRLGRVEEAVNQALQRDSLRYLRGRPPRLELPAALGWSSHEEALRGLAPFARAELLGWKAVRAAALGEPDQARVLLESARAEYAEVARPLQGREMTALVAAALLGHAQDDGGLAEALLPEVSGSQKLERMGRILRSAHTLGAAPTPDDGPGRIEIHLLRALLGRRHALQVAADGSWIHIPGEPRVSLRRKVVLRRALAALSDAPDGLTLSDLIAQTWPDERLVDGSGRRRGEVAISSLRAIGLRDALVTLDGAPETRWRLDATVVPT